MLFLSQIKPTEGPIELGASFVDAGILSAANDTLLVANYEFV